MSYRASENICLYDLLADQATTGLDARRAEMLSALLQGAEGATDGFDLAAASLDVALSSAGAAEAMPASVRASAEAALRQAMGGVAAPAAAPAQLRLAHAEGDADLGEVQRRQWTGPRQAGSSFSWAPWLLAAACLAVVGSVILHQVQPAAPGAPGTPSADALLARAGVVHVDIVKQKDATCAECKGDVIWDNAAQEGVIRLHGLAVNDAAKEQYQLWIIDKTQKHPIDAGVFDVTAQGDLVIPIHAKLKVADPAAFAITVEKPGGVVVSDLGRLAALAPITKG